MEELKISCNFTWITVILLLCILNLIKADPIVDTKLGKVRGIILTSDNGKPFYAFRGIPYAKPPIKHLRFMPPQPIEKWQNTMDATKDRHACIQFDLSHNLITGDEDCLYLNVYTKQLTEGSLRPVMVFIKNGGFNSEDGSAQLYNPELLVDKDVVLVTFNYRLSALALLSMDNAESTGNCGLLDQVEVLKWVQNHVKSFGGDPNSVTIFGESTGSASVVYNLISPLSKGLFHAAIIQSGTTTKVISKLQPEPQKHTKPLAESLNCPTDNSENLFNCMRKRSALDIMIKSSMLELINPMISNPKLLQFQPDIDNGFDGSAELFSQHLRSLLKKQHFNKVPILFGNVKNEDNLLLLLFSMMVTGVDQFHAEHILKTFSEFNEHYEKVFGNLLINAEMDAAVKALTDSGVPIYTYQLAYTDENSITSQFSPFINEDYSKIRKLVSRIDDFQYLFPKDLIENDKRKSKKMITLWTNFAKNKIPSLEGENVDNESLIWNPVQRPNKQPQYHNVGYELHREKENFYSRPHLWKKFQEKDKL